MRCGSSLVRAGLLLAALCPAPAFAQCVLEIDPTNLRNAIGYDPLAIDRTIAEQDLRLVNNGTEVCTARLTVDDGGSAVDEAVMGNSRLQVSWVDGNNISLAANRTAGAGRVISIAPGESTNIIARLVVPTGQLVRAGNYRTAINLQLIEANNASRAILANELIDVSIDVAAVTGVALAGTHAGSRVASVDFGKLEEGETSRVVFTTLTNSDYQLRFAAQNAGALRHESLPAEVPYVFSLNGQALDLSGDADVGFAATARNRQSHDVLIRIGDVSGRPAGRYRDVVRLTIVPRR